MIGVRVPASTANLGPGFDALGMALSLTAEIGLVDGDSSDADRAKQVDEHHPASVAFAAAGGTGTLWVRSPIPMGRGMGYSGAMRAGGAATAVAQQCGGDAHLFAERRHEALDVAARLEGHADNAAASLYGGIVTTDGTRVVPVPTPLDPDVVLWVPPSTTLTAASRTTLPLSVTFDVAVFNIGRTAILVAALATGDIDALRAATEDRLHQEARFNGAESSRLALQSGLAAGAWCGWLSGSGPTVALLADRGAGGSLAVALPPEGRTKIVAIDRSGADLVAPPALR